MVPLKLGSVVANDLARLARAGDMSDVILSVCSRFADHARDAANPVAWNYSVDSNGREDVIYVNMIVPLCDHAIVYHLQWYLCAVV